MISKDNEQLTAYYEGYKPVEHQQNGVVLDTYDDNIYTGEEISVDNTYNDKLLRIGTGKIYGNTALKADYRASYGESTQEVHESASKNLFDNISPPDSVVYNRYYGRSYYGKISGIVTVSVTLKPGKTIPTDVCIGVIYLTPENVSANVLNGWLVWQGVQNHTSLTFNADTYNNPDTSLDWGVCVYPKNQDVWDAVMDAFEIQVELGSEATDFEPYYPQMPSPDHQSVITTVPDPGTYPVNIDGDLYNVSLIKDLHAANDDYRSFIKVDAIRKKSWGVERTEYITVDDSSTYTLVKLSESPTSYEYYIAFINGLVAKVVPAGAVMSDRFLYTSAWADEYGTMTVADNGKVVVSLRGVLTEDTNNNSAAQNWVAQHPTSFILPMATPIETELTMTPITSSTAPVLPLEPIEWTDPSPDYPGEISTAGDLTIEGKNLFDPALLNQTTAFTVEGDRITTNGLRFNYMMYSNATCLEIFRPGTTYYIKCHCKIVSIPDIPEINAKTIGVILYGEQSGVVLRGSINVDTADFVVGKEFDISGYGTITDDMLAPSNNLRLLAYNPGNSTISQYAQVEISRIMISKIDEPYLPYMGQSSAQLPKMYRVKTTSGGNLTIDDQQYISDYVEIRKVDNSAKVILLHNVGTKSFDGTESWRKYENTLAGYAYAINIQDMAVALRSLGYCTHFKVITSQSYQQGLWLGVNNNAAYFICLPEEMASTLDIWKAWLASQAATGTPVTICYPVATPWEEDITNTPEGQSLIASKTIPLYTHIYCEDDVKPYMDISVRTVHGG